MDVSVDVVGIGNREQALGHLAMIGSLQEKLVALQGGRADGPFVTAANIASGAQKLAETLGYRTPGLFFQPAERMAATPPPTPAGLADRSRALLAQRADRDPAREHGGGDPDQGARASRDRDRPVQGAALGGSATTQGMVVEVTRSRCKADVDQPRVPTSPYGYTPLPTRLIPLATNPSSLSKRTVEILAYGQPEYCRETWYCVSLVVTSSC